MSFPSTEQVFPSNLALLKAKSKSELTTPIRCQTIAWRHTGHLDWYPKKDNITAAEYYYSKGMQEHLDHVLSLYTPKKAREIMKGLQSK